MRILKLSICLFTISLATSFCTPQSMDDNEITTMENPQSTNDNDGNISDGSKEYWK